MARKESKGLEVAKAIALLKLESVGSTEISLNICNIF